MAKLTRVQQKIFGSSGAATEFGVFGSDSEGAAATSKDPAVIQSLATFLRGLYGSTANAAQPPRIEDMNALYYLFARQIAYGMQAGIPEWLATENYYANGSVVLGSNGKIYISKTGTDGSPNVNNNPVTDTGTNWRFVWTNDVFSATPLSDLSRVMRINGDGVPTFPDNVAGIVYRNVKDWATGIDGWAPDGNTTLAIVDGQLKAVSLGTDISIEKSGAFSNKQVRFIATTSHIQTVSVRAMVNGVYTLIKNFVVGIGIMTPIDLILPDLSTVIYIVEDGTNVNDSLEIKDIYIGSGLYDTPVYGKDGQTVAVNHGAVPVNGPRGKGLLFQGAQYLESATAWGTSGALAFKFNRKTVGIIEHIFGENVYATNTGVAIYINSGQELVMLYGIGTGLEVQVLSLITADGWHSYVINYTATTVGPVYKDGVQVLAQTPLIGTLQTYNGIARIGCPGWALGDMLNGDLADPRYQITPMTQDDAIRYHNGDDAVDSQQKSATGTPHAIAVFGANGKLNATATQADHAATATQADHAATATQADHAATATQADHAATATEANHATTAGNASSAGEVGGIQRKYIAIGSWDMTETGSKIVPHGITGQSGSEALKKIVNFEVIILNDNRNSSAKLDVSGDSACNQTSIAMSRIPGGIFDFADFSTTTHNRGYIVIDYISTPPL